MRLREFNERQRLDEAVALLPIILGALGITAGASLQNQIDPKKVEKWVSQNTKEAGEFVDSLQKNYGPDVKKPETITNPIGNAISQSWNWLTGGSTKKDNVQQQTKPPQPGDYKKDKNGLLIRKDAEKQIAPKVQYDSYISQYNMNKDGVFRGKIPPQTLGNIRSQGDAGAGWVKQYDDLYKKRSQINKQIAADIKNGLTKQQLDQKYGDNLQNLNRDLNDHLGKVDDYGKGLKPYKDITVKPLTVKPLDIKDLGDDQISINGKTYDKDFDADEIKRIIGNPGVGNQVKSVGGGQSGAVSGQGKKKDTTGATIGSGGMDIGIKGSGAVSGDKGKTIPGDITGPEIGIKGQSIGTTGVGQGDLTGQEIDIKGQSIGKTGTQSNTISKDIAIPKQGNLVRTMPPPPPPPIAQAPQGPKYRKYDPKKDKDIIYKGKVAPKNVVDFKAIKTGVGGMADRLRIK